MAKKWMEGINAEAMDQFMVDLRSGEFEQTQGYLNVENSLVDAQAGMCCLGVATERFHDKCGVSRFVDPLIDGLVRYEWEGEHGRHVTASLMPLPVARHLGIPEEYMESLGGEDVNIYLVAHEGESMTVPSASENLNRRVIGATTLNDHHKYSFAQIADRFEQTFMVEEDENV